MCRDVFIGRALLAVFLVALFSACSDDSSSSSKEPEADVPVDSTEQQGNAIEEHRLSFVGGPVAFTEVDPINVVYEDHEGDDAGWVELYNTSADTVDLSGMYLTDSQTEPFKWKFGTVKLAPNSFLVVFMSGKNYPDYVLPHDTLNMVGPGCWTWTDAQSDPPGESYADPLPGQKKLCFTEDGNRHFGAVMRLGENEELGWSSISAFVGTGSSDKEDVLDISAANEILMQAYIPKDRKVSFRLAQSDMDDWKGYEIVFTGTGDSSTVYRTAVPTGTTYPDLKNIYGTRVSPESNETREVTLKVFSYIARNRGHEPHAGFKLSKSGASLYLVNADSAIVDSVAYPELPVGKTWSFGNLADGSNGFGYGDATPYGFAMSLVSPSRSPSLDTLAELPPSGFFAEPFVVAFPEEAAVRCEQGGLAPTENSPLTTVLQVGSTVTIRCASFVAGALPGEELSRTYVFESAPTVPVVFLTADPGSLFDPDTGIYEEGNFAQSREPHYGANYWLDKEIPVMVELMEPGMNSPAFAKKAGLKIFGNYSRQNDKKSVAITFREKYGDSRLKYALFPDFPELTEFKVFLLRNNGSNYGNDYIRDRLASSVSEGLGVDYQRGRFAVVYYNGEYYGIHSIRERSTEYYFETHYGLNPDEIDLLKADNSVSAGSAVDYVALMDWLEEVSLESEENYAHVASQIDVDNFINYMQIEMYANNRDWPGNNLKKWRSNSPKTLWKWFLYDMDFGMGNSYSDYTNNIFEFAAAEDGESWPNGPEYTLLFRKLLENGGFRAAFVNRMAVLLQMNFESSRVLSRIEQMMSEIEAEIPRDQKRWGLSASKMTKQLNSIRDFAKERPGVVYDELREYFGLGGTAPIKLSVNGPGNILVHGLRLDASSMTVNFFEGFPVEVSAMPSAGGVWAGWSDGVMDVTRVVVPGEIPALTANFN
ncbi:CotH kinase family protein [Fibrobacter sp.]|uniref:CotH kinase family protein n=1 Tax=Fibrobacter sp. TaxID=35828 RepID=UPI00388E8C1F